MLQFRLEIFYPSHSITLASIEILTHPHYVKVANQDIPR